MLKYIPLNQITVPETKLRGVRDGDPEYQDLLLSIQKHGVLEPILLRSIEEDKYSLVNGLQRLSCAQRCQHDVIPARIDENITDDTDALLKSILTNLHTVKTRPFEYANALRMYIRRNSEMTIAELAERLGKSEAWIVDRLALTNLKSKIGKSLDQGNITIRRAQGLALLPEEEQEAVFTKVKEMGANEFYDLCLERNRATRLEKARAPTRAAREFKGHPVLRQRAVLLKEMEHGSSWRDVTMGMGELGPREIWKIALAWAMQLDPLSLEERRRVHMERVSKIEEALGESNGNQPTDT